MGDSEFVYQRFILLRSYLALLPFIDRAEVTLPGDMEPLIEAVYAGTGLHVPPEAAWQLALSEAEEAMESDGKNHRLAARKFLVGQPVSENELLYAFNQQLEEDNPEAPASWRRLRPTGNPSVSLVILYQIDSRLCLDAEGRQPVNLARRPNLDDVRGFLNNAVTIQRKACVFHYLKESPPARRRRNGMLRLPSRRPRESRGRGHAGRVSSPDLQPRPRRCIFRYRDRGWVRRIRESWYQEDQGIDTYLDIAILSLADPFYFAWHCFPTPWG